MSARRKKTLSVVYPNSAEIDVAKDLHVVALPEHVGKDSRVREFGGFTNDLNTLAEWLAEHTVEQVALESTGVYWLCRMRHSQYYVACRTM